LNKKKVYMIKSERNIHDFTFRRLVISITVICGFLASEKINEIVRIRHF